MHDHSQAPRATDAQACTIAAYRAAIVQAWPVLAGAAFRLATAGWDSVAVDVDDRLIFKFPRNAPARAALVREAALLALVRPAVDMPVPAMTLHDGPPLFSRHAKIKGEHLTGADYAVLGETERRRLADALGRFYAELHALDTQRMAAAGAAPLASWQTPERVRERAIPALPPALRAFAEATVAAFEALAPDPHGTTYGFFDGHGWNMAFDHTRGRLAGVYDFADSGIGPLHQDFVYSNFIAPDLTERVIAAYEARTGRAIDRARVGVLTGMHRLSELAQFAHDREHAPAMVRHVGDWHAYARAP